MEPPKINTATADLIKQSIGDIDERLREHTNFQKKNQQINFQEKTPFEKELEQKFHEIKQKK